MRTSERYARPLRDLMRTLGNRVHTLTYPVPDLKISCVLLEYSCVLSMFLTRTLGILVRTSDKLVHTFGLLTSGPKILFTSPSLLTRGLENLFTENRKLIIGTGKLLKTKKAHNPLLSRLWALIYKLSLYWHKWYRLAWSAPTMYVTSRYSCVKLHVRC